MISGAPYRPPGPRPGQRLIEHEGFVPTPKPESLDGYEALEREIAMAEEKLELMRGRLSLLRSRAQRRRRKTSVSIEKIAAPAMVRR